MSHPARRQLACQLPSNGRRFSSRRRSRGATIVEFALVGPILLLTMIGLASAVWFVVESQVANYAAQAAARWSVAAANFDQSLTPAAPYCTSLPGTYVWTAAPGESKMLSAAAAAAGPFSGEITASTLETSMAPTANGNGYGCEIKVVLPYSSFGGFFKLGPTQITAYAIDYVT